MKFKTRHTLSVYDLSVIKIISLGITKTLIHKQNRDRLYDKLPDGFFIKMPALVKMSLDILDNFMLLGLNVEIYQLLIFEAFIRKDCHALNTSHECGCSPQLVSIAVNRRVKPTLPPNFFECKDELQNPGRHRTVTNLRDPNCKIINDIKKFTTEYNLLTKKIEEAKQL